MDAVTLAVFRHRLEAIADEMGEALGRTAVAPNIKERHDYSCALFDADGQLVAQAAHIPVHLGSMPLSVAAAIEQGGDLRPGDTVILNDPYRGGTHLPDVTMVSPVDRAGRRLGFVATRAHHADIGGMSPGSMPLATEIHQEGLIIPPIHVRRSGRWDEDVLALLTANVRTPAVFRADLEAQQAAQTTGAARLLEVAERDGDELVAEAMGALIDYSERATRAMIATIPDGRHEAEDVLESATDGRPLAIRVRVEVAGDEVTIDFSGSHPQVEQPLNAVLAVTTSAVLYCFTCLLEREVPSNAGCVRPLTIVADEGSIVHCRTPAPVSAGNVETSQRIVDVVFRALAGALPDVIPAAGQGTMNNVSFGGWDADRDRPFAYYETIGGGMGASPHGDGLSGVHVAMSNTLNTPAEALEHELPLRILAYRLRHGSGGDGRHRGGDGIERSYQFLAPARGTLIADRRIRPPWGLAGGESGAVGRDLLNDRPLPSKCEFSASPGDVLTVMTPGGGGWGRVADRPRRP